jgi:hypothetical protein
MPLSKIDAKIRNIDRIVKFGKRDVLQIVDRNTREVLATIKEWGFKRLNPMQKGAPSFSFYVTPDNTTSELLALHNIALNGRIHDVIVRDAPASLGEVEWTLRTSPTNSFILE